jgi:hypothetical protein
MLNSISLKAQTNQSDKPFFMGITSYAGQFQVHTKSLYPYNDTHPIGVELEFSQLLLKEQIRETFGTFIKWGAGINYVNFNHEDLGYAITGIGYIEPFLESYGQWRFSIKLGAGLAYMSNPYDEISNPQNLTYSTNLAFPLYAGSTIYYYFTKQLALKTSLSFQHISNGGIRQPNLGINYPVFGIGMEFTNNSYRIPPRQKLHTYTKKKQYEIIAGYSLKEDTTNTNNLHVATLMINRSWQVSRINALTITLFNEYQQSPSDTDNKEKWSIAPLFGNEFLLGRLGFGQQLGIYVIQGDQAPNLLLQNYYLRYNFNSGMIAGINLKAHGRVADFLSIQVGFKF